MSLTVLGLCGIASEPVCTNLDQQNNTSGKFYSCRIVSSNPRHLDRIHRYTISIWVPKEDEKTFLQHAKRGEVFLLRFADLVEYNGNLSIRAILSNFNWLKEPRWHPSPEDLA